MFSIEHVRELKEVYKIDPNPIPEEHPLPIQYDIQEAFDTIEAQQKEIDNLNTVWNLDKQHDEQQIEEAHELIKRLKQQIEAQHSALLKAKEALRIIEFINNDGHDNGICPYCRHDEHESFCYVSKALSAIDKVI